MLIVYRLDTGEVVDNTGTCSSMPEGPAGAAAYANTDAAGIDRAELGLLRLHDEDDAELVVRALTHEHAVDPVTGELVFGAEHVPEEPEPSAADLESAARQDRIGQLQDVERSPAEDAELLGLLAAEVAYLRGRS